MLKKDLKKLKLMKISELNEIQDISLIDIDEKKSQEDRAAEFFEKVNNPYIVRVGDITMKINFSGEKSLSEAIINAINYA